MDRIDIPKVVQRIKEIYRDLSQNNYDNLVASGVMEEEIAEGIKSIIESYKKILTVPSHEELDSVVHIYFYEPESSLVKEQFEIEHRIWFDNEVSDLRVTLAGLEMVDGRVDINLLGMHSHQINNPEVIRQIEQIYRDLAGNNYQNLVDVGIIKAEAVEVIKERIASYWRNHSVTIPPPEKLTLALAIWFDHHDSTSESLHYMIEQYVWLDGEESDLVAKFKCWETKNTGVIVKLYDLLTM